MVGSAVAIVVTGAILVFVGVVVGLSQSSRVGVHDGVRTRVINLGVVLLLVGTVGVIFGAAMILFEVISTG